jgi:hypothetical protein
MESRRAYDASTARYRRKQSRNNAMDVKEGHDIQACIVSGELQRSGDIPRGAAQVPVGQRDNLWPARRARSVQYQRDGIRRRHLRRCSAASQGVERKDSGSPLVVGDESHNRYTKTDRSLNAWGVVIGTYDERTSVEIAQVELELRNRERRV